MHLSIELKLAIVFALFYLMLSCSADAGYGNYGSYGYYGQGGQGGSGGQGGQVQSQGHGYTDRFSLPDLYPYYYPSNYHNYYRPPVKKSFKKTALGILAGLTGGLLLLGGLMPTLALGGMAGAGLGGFGPGLGGGLGGGALPILGGLYGASAGAGAGASAATGLLPAVSLGKRSLPDTTDTELYDRTLKNVQLQLASVRSPADCRRMLKMCDRELKRWLDQGLQMAGGPPVVPASTSNSLYDGSRSRMKEMMAGGPKGDYAAPTMTHTDVRKPDDEAQLWCHRVLPQCVHASASTPPPKGILHKT